MRGFDEQLKTLGEIETVPPEKIEHLQNLSERLQQIQAGELVPRQGHVSHTLMS